MAQSLLNDYSKQMSLIPPWGEVNTTQLFCHMSFPCIHDRFDAAPGHPLLQMKLGSYSGISKSGSNVVRGVANNLPPRALRYSLDLVAYKHPLYLI